MRKVLALLLFAGMAVVFAQIDDYTKALTTLYAAGKTAQFARDWCVQRVPKSEVSASFALEAWRTAQGIPEIETRFKALMGNAFAGVEAKLEAARPDLYQSLEKNVSNPESICMNLAGFYSQSLNLRVTYANEYQIIATRALPNTNTAPTTKPNIAMPTTKPVLSNPPVVPNSGLPNVAVLTPMQLEAMGIDPDKEPTPDEYRCYAKSRSDQYQQPSLILQILPKRQYRFAGGSGSFKVDRDDIIFTSGAWASKEDHYFHFRRKSGTEIWLYNIGVNETDYRCHQRGSADNLAQLEFKRKDPPVGTYSCFSKDGKGTDLGKLEILASRQYRYNNQIGQIKVDILGDQSDDYSSIDFVGGAWDDENAFYEEDEYGQQVWSVYASPKMDCSRQSTPRPNPKFGSSAAPKPPSGTGGLEGRFYHWQIEIPIGGNYYCGGLCYDYAFFNKNGYVFVSDPEDMEGIEDTDCNKTYPSGYPICDVYRVSGGKITIGKEKAQSFKRSNKGISLDGTSYEPLLPLGNLTLQGTYNSFTASSSTIGAPSGFTSNVDYIFATNGRFTRDANSSAFVSATSDGTAFGSTTASSSSWSQRKNSGTYRIYSNTLELKYLDGRVIRKFMFAVDKDKSFYRIGGRDYTRKK